MLLFRRGGGLSLRRFFIVCWNGRFLVTFADSEVVSVDLSIGRDASFAHLAQGQASPPRMRGGDACLSKPLNPAELLSFLPSI